MGRGKKNKPVSPIYTIAVIFLLFTLFKPIRTLLSLIFVAALAAVGFFLVRAFVTGKNGKAAPEAEKTPAQEAQRQQTPQRPAAKPEPKYSPEVQAVVDEGKKAQTELQHLYECIPDLAVKRKIVEIMDVSDKIVRDAIADPSDVPQIKKFLDYYLPTTIKLLNAYDRMGAQGVSGENIAGTMSRVENMMGTIVSAFEKQLDALFGAEAMDISTDITVLENLMQREGLVTDTIHQTVTETVNDNVSSASGGSAVAGIGDIKLEL